MRRLDRDGEVPDAQVFGECFCIRQGCVRAVARRHGNSEHILRAQRSSGDDCRQSGINSTAQADDRACKAALVEIVLRAEHERAKRGFKSVMGDIRDRLGQRIKVHHDQVRFELFRLGHQFASRIDHHAAAVEDQLIIAADLIHVDYRQGEFPCPIGEQALACLDLVEGEWRRREVEDCVRALLCQRAKRVEAISESQRAFGTPEVLADCNAEFRFTKSCDVRIGAGLEVASLIEDVIRGQQRFVMHGNHPAIHDECR